MSAIAWHFEGSQFSTEHLDAGYLVSLKVYSRIGARFLERVVEALLGSLVRLNALPRDDAFWDGRTHTPTLQKLRDHCASIVQKSPNDVPALWAQIGLNVVHGTNNFGAKQWRRLHSVGEFDISFPILSALVTELNSDPTIEALVELIDRLDLKPQTVEYLESLEVSESPWIDEWRSTVLAGLAS